MAAQALQLPQLPETNEPYPQRYKFLAAYAYDQGKITQMQMARFLRCEDDVFEARRILAQCLTSSDVTAEGQLQTIQLEQSEKSLLSSAS